MGNIVGSIHWQSTIQDNYYKEELNKLYKKYNLIIIKPDVLHYRLDYNNYGVTSPKNWILLYGRNYIRNQINLFLAEAEYIFGSKKKLI